MKSSYVTFGVVLAIVLVAGPAVLRSFFGDYPWQIRFAVVGILVLALGVAFWPSKKTNDKN
jgi:hypothetical protein